jgi:hypothetical protein
MPDFLILPEQARAAHHAPQPSLTVPAEHQNLVECGVAAAVDILALQALFAKSESNVICTFRKVLATNQPQHYDAPEVDFADTTVDNPVAGRSCGAGAVHAAAALAIMMQLLG